jgi:thiol-disulfide isomerase/thioredoxin
MKKLIHYILPVFAVSMLVSCGGPTEETAEPVVEKGHVITGKVQGAEGQEAKLIVLEGGLNTAIDSCLIVNGAFELSTKTKELRQYLVYVADELVLLFLDPESKDVTITGSMPGIGRNYEVTGSDFSQRVHDYMLFVLNDYDKEVSLINEVNSTNPEDKKQVDYLMARLDSIFVQQREYAIENIMKDTTSPVSWLLLNELFPVTGMAGFDSSDIKYFYMVSNGMRSRFPNSEYPALIDDQIAGINAQYQSLAEAAVEGGKAPEINLNDTNGKPLPLSSLRGKVVLIDFWASWCMPCRQENPNVVKMYEKYKNKGFTVYSVSLDESKDAWIKAINADNLSWPNHVSDLKGWQSEAAAAYSVSAIPATFLLDKEGNIVAQNLRGPELEQKLQEILD